MRQHGRTPGRHRLATWLAGVADTHFMARFDNGTECHNIEATDTGRGGFASPSDREVIERYGLPDIAIRTGSDLRAVTPRELLGIFVQSRGRHFRDTGQWVLADRDYALARHLFPRNRSIYRDTMAQAVTVGGTLFEPNECGSPWSLADYILQGFPGQQRLLNHIEMARIEHLHQTEPNSWIVPPIPY